jgi:hypothetical protein
MFGNPAVVTVLNEANQTKNMSAAIARHSAKLTEAEKKTLMSLTQADLEAMQRINAKLAPLGVKAVVD